MKILAFVDLHSDLSSLDKILKKAERADIIVCAGDFTLFGKEQEKILYKLNKLNKPVFVIHGNHENEAELKTLCKMLNNCNFIHGKIFQFKDFLIIGWGGEGFSSVSRKFEKFYEKNKNKLKGKNIILVTHAPPYGCKLDNIHGMHAGNKSITRFIKLFKPILNICGHLHENAKKKDKIKSTLIVNPGWDGKIIEI